MGFGQIIAKGFLEHQDFDLQQFTFIITPAFSNIGWNIRMGDDRDLLKEKSKVFRTFPQNEPLYLSFTYAEQWPSLCDRKRRRIRWYFLTFKKHLLISTNRTISLILLLSSFAIKWKKESWILLFTEYHKHCPVLSAVTTHLEKKGEALVCCLRSAPTEDRKAGNTWHQINVHT